MTPAAAPAAPRGLRRWLPRSLFGRLVLVLASGLLIAQLLSAAINAVERERLVAGSFGMQAAQRIADVVKLLDGLGEAERAQVVAVLRVPPLVLSLADAARVPADAAAGWQAAMFTTRLRAALGEDRDIRVQPREGFAPGPGLTMPMAGAGPPGPMHGPMHGGGRGMMGAGPGVAQAVVRTEVRLRDGRWAAFDTALPAAQQALPWRLVLTLGVLLLGVLAVSYVAVRWVVRPLQRLTEAAEGLGHDLDRAPMPEDGPLEVQQAARAFNTMQRRLATFIHDRARILSALSHDLKTPLTRMRLRAELLDDDELRTRFESDLKEMEGMVAHTLEFMRGLGGNQPRQPVDLMGLLESLQADQQALGRRLRIEGQASAPLIGVASLLKRGLANLVDNAALYGGAATVRIEDSPAQVVLHVLDEGPGIAEAELERVFEPFYRLETSRSRATGGTGLGLGIARNVARSHGGEVVLRNRPEGGLDAVMTLPRDHAPR